MNAPWTANDIVQENAACERELKRALDWALPPLLTMTARIKTKPNGTFYYSDAGDLATLCQVEDRLGLPLDVVAELPSGHWHLRKGLGVILGVPFLSYCESYEQPLPIFCTPQSFVDHGGKGVVVLNWDSPVSEIFKGVPVLQFETRGLHERYRETLKRSMPRSELMA